MSSKQQKIDAILKKYDGTVIDDPVRIDDLTEQQALDYIRDIFTTWYYFDD